MRCSSFAAVFLGEIAPYGVVAVKRMLKAALLGKQVRASRSQRLPRQSCAHASNVWHCLVIGQAVAFVMRERRLLAEVKHPCIVNLLATAQVRPGPCNAPPPPPRRPAARAPVVQQQATALCC